MEIKMSSNKPKYDTYRCERCSSNILFIASSEGKIIKCQYCGKRAHLVKDSHQSPAASNNVDFRGQILIRNYLQTHADNGEIGPPLLLIGETGIGKLTIARKLAEKLGVFFISANASSIKKTEDLTELLLSLENGDLLFIEEIDQLKPSFIECLTRALSGQLDIAIGENDARQWIHKKIPLFTLIGASTKKSLVAVELLNLFPVVTDMGKLSEEELLIKLARDCDIKNGVKIITSSDTIDALGSKTEAVTERENIRISISAKVRRVVWRRDQGKCAKCSSRKNLEYDHIIPVSKGGSNTERNIELLCESCNRSKSDAIQ
jgi:Holliday junction resolvasome RuvABC ATP-dependent DNA helicase subunit